MRIVAALALVLVAWCSAASARAADLSGVWEIDQPAWEQQLDRIVGAMLDRMPPEATAQLKAQGIDPAEMLRRSAAEGMNGTVEFLPGGVVRTTSAAEGSKDDGRWSIAGDEVRIEVEDADNLDAMVGTVEGDRMTLRPVMAGENPDLAFMREMVFPLVRRR